MKLVFKVLLFLFSCLKQITEFRTLRIFYSFLLFCLLIFILILLALEKLFQEIIIWQVFGHIVPFLNDRRSIWVGFTLWFPSDSMGRVFLVHSKQGSFLKILLFSKIIIFNIYYKFGHLVIIRRQFWLFIIPIAFWTFWFKTFNF